MEIILEYIPYKSGHMLLIWQSIMVNEVNRIFWTYQWKELRAISFHLNSVPSFDMLSLSVLLKYGSIKDVTCVLSNCVHFVTFLMNRVQSPFFHSLSQQLLTMHLLYNSVREGESSRLAIFRAYNGILSCPILL